MSAIEADAFAPEGDDHQDREHYKIGGKSEADWALRKLAKARAVLQENQTLFAEEVRRLEQWREEASRKASEDATYFEAILRNWHQEQLTEDEKAKTIKLPGGQLKARKKPDSIVVDDLDAFVAWANKNKPTWVRTKYEPVKDEIKAAGGVDPETGEIAPGIDIYEGDITWSAVTE